MLKAYGPGYWTHVFVISPTALSQKHLWSYLDVLPERIFTSTNLQDLKAAMTSILTTLKGTWDAYRADLMYREAYEKLTAGQVITPAECGLLESRDCMPPGPVLPRPNAVVLVDDMQGLRALDTHWWTSMVVRHRHLAGGCGISILSCVQSLRASLSRAVRQCANYLALYATHDKTAIEDLSKECAGHVTRAEFVRLFELATSRGPHEFLSIDLTQPAGRVFTRSLEESFGV
jgi:hypothetical protein